MANTPISRRGRAPRTDSEWAREIQRRVETLESSPSVRIGPWVLNARDGDLIATTKGSSVVLSDPVLAVPVAGRPSRPSNLLTVVEDLTGLDFSSPQAFFASLMNLITGNDGPQLIFDSIGDLLAQITDGIKEALDKAGEDIEKLFAEIAEALKLDEWQAFLDNLWLNMTGVKPDTTITANDVTDEFALLVANAAAQATTITQLQAAINKPPGGIVGGDDFERGNGPLGSGWKIVTDNSNGTYEVRNGEAAWKREGILANFVRCFRIDPKDAKTATPYQAVTRVTGTTVLQTIALANSADDIVFARVSDNHTAYMLAWWDIGVDGKGKLHLGYNLGSGGEKEVQVVPCPKPAPGVTLTLQCGDADDLYSYRVIRANTVLIEWDDTTKVTQPLVTNRGWGFGGRSVFGALGQYAPSSAHSVTVVDTKSP